MSTPIKAIAFDLDGTLVNSLPDLAAAGNAARAAVGLPPLDEARISSHVGDGMARFVHRAITDDRDQDAPAEQWEAGIRAFAEHYRTNLTRNTRPYPGVADALPLLKSLQLPLAVITNKPAAFTTPLLAELGMDHLFSLVLGGDSLPTRKPSAEPLLHCAQVFGVAPSELLMVGDSANDLLAARAAGAQAMLVDYGYAHGELPEPDYKVSSLVELFELLKNG